MENQISFSEKANNKEEEKTLLLPQKEKKEMTCISIACWVLQIIIWIGGISFLFIKIREKDWYTGSYELTIEFIMILIFECIAYVFYIILELCSPTFGYLRHKRTDVKIYDKMKQLFYSQPMIQLICECYHYETTTVRTYDSKGNYTTSTQTRRVVTRVASKFFNYYSARDVSGLFLLNYDKNSINDKYYVKLELLTDFNFADSVTYSDYEKEKNEFCDENRHYDIFMDFYRRDDIPGLTRYNLINITENNPCGMSCFWFVFFTFIGMAQIYKSYIESKCIYKSFTIRKLISTRYSLTNLECDEKYKKLDPVISFGEDNIKFPSSRIGHLSNDFKQNPPTKDEIESAKKYSDKVFKIADNKEDNINVEFNNIKNKNENNDNDNNIEANLGESLLPDSNF